MFLAFFCIVVLSEAKDSEYATEVIRCSQITFNTFKWSLAMTAYDHHGHTRPFIPLTSIIRKSIYCMKNDKKTCDEEHFLVITSKHTAVLL